MEFGLWLCIKKGYFTKKEVAETCKENMGCEGKVKDEQSAEKEKQKVGDDDFKF